MMIYRSNRLNKYYWGVLLPLARDALMYAGYERECVGTNDLTHSFFKDVLHIESTQVLTNKEFIEYVEDIIRICAVYLHAVIPYPNEVENESDEETFIRH